MGGGGSGVRIFIVEKLVNISYWKTRFITSDIDISIPTFGRSGWFFGIAKTHSMLVALPVACSIAIRRLLARSTTTKPRAIQAIYVE